MCQSSSLTSVTPDTLLSADDLHRSLTLPDLSDPTNGVHAINLILKQLISNLTSTWNSSYRIVRVPALVSVADNYDRLGYRRDDVTRESRYSRYASPTTMLRSHTSANIPDTLQSYVGVDSEIDELIGVPGLVYRRDVVDRTHVAEPHQLDLWRLRSSPDTGEDDLEQLISIVVDTVLPGSRWRSTPADHPYTRLGRQVDVHHDGAWLELAECGLIHPHVLAGSGLDPDHWSGLALGLGLDRAVMLRKRIPDIRYLRSAEPRMAAQLTDLDRWRPVSLMPPITRDLSIVIDADTSDETIGDTVRSALGNRVTDIESVVTVDRTAYDELPPRAQARLGMTPGQVNALIRLTLRPIERTLTDAEANEIRNQVYRAVHRGHRLELA